MKFVSKWNEIPIFVMITKIKIGIMEIFKSHWDFITGAGYGTLLIIQKQSIFETIWHTLVVTLVAFLAKKFLTWAYDEITKIWK